MNKWENADFGSDDHALVRRARPCTAPVPVIREHPPRLVQLMAKDGRNRWQPRRQKRAYFEITDVGRSRLLAGLVFAHCDFPSGRNTLRTPPIANDSATMALT